jgi:hypothetical protein
MIRGLMILRRRNNEAHTVPVTAFLGTDPLGNP